MWEGKSLCFSSITVFIAASITATQWSANNNNNNQKAKSKSNCSKGQLWKIYCQNPFQPFKKGGEKVQIWFCHHIWGKKYQQKRFGCLFQLYVTVVEKFNVKKSIFRVHEILPTTLEDLNIETNSFAAATIKMERKKWKIHWVLWKSLCCCWEIYARKLPRVNQALLWDRKRSILFRWKRQIFQREKNSSWRRQLHDWWWWNIWCPFLIGLHWSTNTPWFEYTYHLIYISFWRDYL